MKKVITKMGDGGTTSIGAGGVIKKSSNLIEFFGLIDQIKVHTFTLKDDRKWLETMLTEMLSCIVMNKEFNSDKWLTKLEEESEKIRDLVEFTEDGWFCPETRDAYEWDVMRVLVRKAEVVAWRVYEERDLQQKYMNIAKTLNRLSDYSFLMCMFIDKGSK